MIFDCFVEFGKFPVCRQPPPVVSLTEPTERTVWQRTKVFCEMRKSEWVLNNTLHHNVWLGVGIMFSTCCPSVRSFVTNFVSMIFWKRMNRFCWKLAQEVSGARRWNSQLWESAGDRSRSYYSEVWFGASFSTLQSSRFSNALIFVARSYT